ncbi:hypothetical protein GAMM_30103 [Gammaproteobacteria bacterium]
MHEVYPVPTNIKTRSLNKYTRLEDIFSNIFGEGKIKLWELFYRHFKVFEVVKTIRMTFANSTFGENHAIVMHLILLLRAGSHMEIYKGINKSVLTAVLVGSLTLCAQSAKGDPGFSYPTIPVIDPGRIQERIVPAEPRNLVNPTEILEQKNTSISKSQKSVVTTKFKLSNIVVSGVTVYKKGELQQYYKSYLGKDISLSDLKNIAAAITKHYHDQGYVFSRAIIPVQQFVSGKAYIQVIEGKR